MNIGFKKTRQLKKEHVLKPALFICYKALNFNSRIKSHRAKISLARSYVCNYYLKEELL